MPAYNFQKRFAPLIETGVKRHTIRPKRKRPTKLGDTLYLYVGQRSKDCRKLLETTCTRLEPVFIDVHFVQIGQARLETKDELERLAINDGFGSITEFYKFFRRKYNLSPDNPLCDLELIGWDYPGA